MIDNHPSNVSLAFEMLLKEVDAEIDLVYRVGANAFNDRDSGKVKETLDRSDALTGFRERVAALSDEWEEMATAERGTDQATYARRRKPGKQRKGQRTPDSAYFLPILQAIDDMGGSGKVADVLKRVKKIVKPMLKPKDLKSLPSTPNEPRWHNAARWARAIMVDDGLLKDGSPRGVWEISDRGRQTLKDSGKQGSD
ncbi:MAG: winged helix-turn-helix domain-containing protein [Planctomycetota bacterium]|jgi:hypothetical protein|nr:winged helix-turn-helix domain-containing protein [Planctomycetota bacterium]